MRSLLCLGSTGSIGSQTLDLVRADPQGLRVMGLSAARSVEALLAQVREFRPAFVALADADAAERLRPDLPAGTTLFSGTEANLELIAAADFDVCVHGIVGAAGLQPSAAVLERGRTLALANKESLVLAGALLMDLARERGTSIVPVDSEHSAIFQCLRGERMDRVRRVVLTASGGPFRDHDASDLARVTRDEALCHPTWEMGPRITIGSATLMNKALEVIETHHLYGLEAGQIEVTIHRQSVVHSMVEFVDGSVMAQMGPPDMRGPIHYALHHPDRRPNNLVGFDLGVFRELTFEAPDHERFPALALGYRCVEEGGDAGCVLNAADEVAVQAFLDGRIRFPDLVEVNRRTLDGRAAAPALRAGIDGLIERDAWARAAAAAAVVEFEGLPAS
ncbi:1-deoxy-D-xylulose-5-phosphate reductoisomerase [Engelhardtia mirabilis]|uniref:1-deoxy-D-xylulose 5-phosphate reductoisomerase n=1 Tax=Engelhardtia mirabilis TaxID=2528011 RepID=A0A518BKQ7_9BACT|nr:1-deoxy-D-xylulose 5-phosphate reductoisomerase [Planctomycetes bacterium Pla133]QDV01884.1 1-deoxy-D-xylulose 5-phosphate reductoisomerase [Planctomycetes bacterium Pla86]